MDLVASLHNTQSMAQTPPKILIFLGSVRVGRMSDRVGKFVRTTVEANGMEPIVFGNFVKLTLLPFSFANTQTLGGQCE